MFYSILQFWGINFFLFHCLVKKMLQQKSMFALIYNEHMVLRDLETELCLWQPFLISFCWANKSFFIQINFIFLPPLDTATLQVFYQVFLAYWAKNKWNMNLEYITLLSCGTIIEVLLLYKLKGAEYQEAEEERWKEKLCMYPADLPDVSPSPQERSCHPPCHICFQPGSLVHCPRSKSWFVWPYKRSKEIVTFHQLCQNTILFKYKNKYH